MRKTRDPISNLREKLLDSGLADTDDIKVPKQWAVLQFKNNFVSLESLLCFQDFLSIRRKKKNVKNRRFRASEPLLHCLECK